MDRRFFMKLGAASMMSCILPARAAQSGERSLSLYNIHTGERWSEAYWRQGRYLPDSLDAINHILRDYRTGEVAPIAPQLLDLACQLAQAFDSKQPFHVISGYRSPATNSRLAELDSRVAKRSQHVHGRALDLFLPGASLEDLRHAALGLGRGGVGYYPASEFVHVDIGPVRSWVG